MITKERLETLFRYDPETGELWWRTSGKGRDTSKPAGTKTPLGYVVIMLDYQRYMAHRLIWFMHYEKWPDFEIDHVDRNGVNNRLANLRDVPHAVNLFNLGMRADNTSGVRGVCWDRQKSKWKVQVGPAGRRIVRHFRELAEAEAFARDVTCRISAASA